MEQIITCQDPVFGQMQYQHYWKKKETLKFWGKDREIVIGARAFKQRPITDGQREGYRYFKENYKSIEETSRQLALKYVLDEHLGMEPENMPVLKTVLFTRTDEIVLLFDCVWDEEHGFAIQVYPEYKTGSQDLFL